MSSSNPSSARLSARERERQRQREREEEQTSDHIDEQAGVNDRQRLLSDEAETHTDQKEAPNSEDSHFVFSPAPASGRNTQAADEDEEDEKRTDDAPLLSHRRGAAGGAGAAAAGGAVAAGAITADTSSEGKDNEEKNDGKPNYDAPEEEELDYWAEIVSAKSFYLMLFVAAVVEGSQSMSSLALQYMLKDDLDVSPSQQSILFGIVSIPWVIKPVWGFMSDGFPIFGYHRRSYLFLGAMLSCIMWIVMTNIKTHTWASVLGILLGVEVGHAVLSTVAKALLVEHCDGRSQKYTSWLQTYYHAWLYAASLLFAFWGGWALQHGTKKSTIFAITSVTPGLGAIVSLFVLEKIPHNLSIREQISRLWQVVRYPVAGQPYALWRPMLFMVLFSMGPNSGTAMFYFFTEELGFNPQFVASMNMISTLFALIGVLLYQKYFSTVPHRVVLTYGMLISVSFAMLPILVVTRVNLKMGIPDQVFMLSDKAVTATVSRIAHLPVLVMGAQLCPPGIEGTLYALMMSMLNLGAMIAEHNSALAMWALGVKKGSYKNLPWLITICCICAILPLLLLNTLLPWGGNHRPRPIDSETAEEKDVKKDGKKGDDEEVDITGTPDVVIVPQHNPLPPAHGHSIPTSVLTNTNNTKDTDKLLDNLDSQTQSTPQTQDEKQNQ